MEMRTRLTWLQEKLLQNYFGGKQFCLLYKASIHKFSSEELLGRCCNQGPTITVIYSQNYVIGAYIQKSYQRESNLSITLFVLQDTEISERKIGPCIPTTLFSKSPLDDWDLFFQDIPVFSIDLISKKVTMSSNIRASVGLPKDCAISIQECEVFRCKDLLDKRKKEEVFELRNSLLSAMRTYKPYGDLVHQARILLVGPVGAGKSSFFNSVKSVFRGHVTHQALVGSTANGISEEYRTYSIKDGNDGNSLPFVLCDSLGLSEKGGLCEEDIVNILKGHISDRYRFNPMKPIISSHQNYIHDPLLNNRIHCVAFVFDANSVEQLSQEMVAKIKRIVREVIKCGVVYVALLTHVDSVDLITAKDFIDIYNCVPVKLKLEALHRKLGFTLSDILVVSNYVYEWALNPLKDILILSALRQMLWATDDFLEDLPSEETEE